MTHLLLTIFLGWTGYARFRKGQIGLGVLWLFTVGCFMVGWIIDIIDAVKEMNGGAAPAPAAPAFGVNMQFYDVVSDFHTKVVGVTFKNDDGSDRQTIISQCKAGQDVVFKPTPSKKYPDAIGVFTSSGKQLGNVSADLAGDLLKKYGNNPMQVTIAGITGGGDNNYGCNLHVVIYAMPQQ